MQEGKGDTIKILSAEQNLDDDELPTNIRSKSRTNSSTCQLSFVHVTLIPWMSERLVLLDI